MSANMFWGFSVYTGTPKTTDTTMGLLWAKSSQCEWVIPCKHCGKYNIPNPDHDLLKMIGNRGAICAKCGGVISPADGGYVAAYPDRLRTFPGYHISQTIHPLHLFNQAKWGKLLHKVKTYSTLALYNEVFGWPYDLSVSPLTLGDLVKSCHTIRAKTPADLEGVLLDYRWIAVGVDWHGGGLLSDSFTSIAVVGLRKDGDVLDVLYGERLSKMWTPAQEADYILYWVNGVGADCFAFDNGGAGFLRLEMMKQRGLLNRLNLITVPFNYVRPHSGDIVNYNAAKREADMAYYTLDKSRSLAVGSQAIKDARLRLPPFDQDDESAYQRDWLALREDPRKSLGGEVVILIIKKPGVPDDFAHATNFAASAIWDHYGAYPPLGRRYDPTVLEYDEENNRIVPDDVFGPRGSFDRFQMEVDARAAVVHPSDMFD